MICACGKCAVYHGPMGGVCADCLPKFHGLKLLNAEGIAETERLRIEEQNAKWAADIEKYEVVANAEDEAIKGFAQDIFKLDVEEDRKVRREELKKGLSASARGKLDLVCMDFEMKRLQIALDTRQALLEKLYAKLNVVRSEVDVAESKLSAYQTAATLGPPEFCMPAECRWCKHKTLAPDPPKFRSRCVSCGKFTAFESVKRQRVTGSSLSAALRSPYVDNHPMTAPTWNGGPIPKFSSDLARAMINGVINEKNSGADRIGNQPTRQDGGEGNGEGGPGVVEKSGDNGPGIRE